MTDRISVIGLGKLGASMAAALASRGFEVIGVDIDPDAVALLNNGEAPVAETGLAELIAANKERIRATTDISDAVINSDVSFVIVPTPSKDDGSFSLDHLRAACSDIGSALKEKNSYHSIVITSTVLPGSTSEVLIPTLEASSGRTAGRDFGVCYSPEFIALGSVIRDFLNPDFTLIGEFDDRSGAQLEKLYERVVTNDARSARMSLENAELAKIAVNTFVTTKITFANILAEICGRLPTGDIDVVTQALGLDSRIGGKYLTGSLGYGGPCFPRDNAALSSFAQTFGVASELMTATDETNRGIPQRIVERVRQSIEPGGKVAVLGLAYKPLTPVTEESQGLAIAERLADEGFKVVAFDPLANAVATLPAGIQVAGSIPECLCDASAVVITTPDPAFTCLLGPDFEACRENVAVFDLWRILRDELESQPSIHYFGIGLGPDTASTDQARAAQAIND